jgi:nicotinate-nucleotide adenylyltransferase
MSKIGILGGTFNPIHLGHLLMAEAAFKQFDLDKVLFMPSGNPAHKQNINIIPDHHREEMVKISIADNPHFEISTIELEREGITYTADTLLYLASINPDITYYFILGVDSFFQIETWKNADIIMSIAHILVAPRYNMDKEAIEEQVQHLKEKYHANISVLNILSVEISSKQIRSRVRDQESISDFVSDKEMKYIYKNNLYNE